MEGLIFGILRYFTEKSRWVSLLGDGQHLISPSINTSQSTYV